MPKNNRFILSLGGSLIVPEEIDTMFLKSLKKLLTAQTKKDQSFVLAPGGGKVCRKYQAAARNIIKLSAKDSDWLGIYTIHLNSLLLQIIFKGVKNVKVLDMKEIVPGHSSDFDAVETAKNHKAATIINLSNIDYVYDKNPKTHKDAKPIKKISWRDYRSIVGNKWDPGLSTPFDPIASKIAEKLGLKVIILNGAKMANFANCLNGKAFIGTVIG